MTKLDGSCVCISFIRTLVILELDCCQCIHIWCTYTRWRSCFLPSQPAATITNREDHLPWACVRVFEFYCRELVRAIGIHEIRTSERGSDRQTTRLFASTIARRIFTANELCATRNNRIGLFPRIVQGGIH